MKKSLTILSAVLLIAAGCKSWEKEDKEMNEPSGAQSQSSMRTNQLNNSSSDQKNYSTEPKQDQQQQNQNQNQQ